jgi:hypothetical protein
MSTDAGPFRLRLILGVLVIAGAAVGLGWFLVAGTTKLPPTHRAARTEVPQGDPVAAARDAFVNEPTLANCLTFLRQLNEDLQQHPEQKPAPLPEQEQRLLFGTYRLRTDELRKEIESATFTPADSYYLEACVLLSSALRASPLEADSQREQARLVFEWVTRQMRLTPPGHFFLPQYHLKHGRGGAFAREWLFLASLEQLGIPGCTVQCPDSKGAKYRFTGALADGEIYLFDLELGAPLPGAQPGEVATLAQIESHPDLLRMLAVDKERPYDLQPKDRDIRPAWSASVAPRMRYLEERLTLPHPVRLRVNPIEIHRQWEKAARGPLLTPPDALSNSGGWHLPNLTPLYWTYLALSRSGEPGSDRATPALRFYMSLVPWNYLPVPIQALESHVDPGARLRTAYAAPFERFYLKPGGPRDLILRGRLDQAATLLVEMRDQLQEVRRQAKETPKLEATVRDWCAAARQAQADMFATEGKGPEAQAARERLQQVWSKEQVGPVLLLLHASAAEPLGIEVEYQLALCKHEQAERLQLLHDRKQEGDAEALREAWRSAVERWQKFVSEHPKAPGEGSARMLGGRALERLGEREAALALVQECAHLPEWDKRACLYRAKLLAGMKK